MGTIHPAHLAIVKVLLEAGKSVLCEKPMGMNVKETKEMLKLAKEKAVRPGFLNVHNLIVWWLKDAKLVVLMFDIL